MREDVEKKAKEEKNHEILKNQQLLNDKVIEKSFAKLETTLLIPAYNK
jgi:hypothetical protein